MANSGTSFSTILGWSSGKTLARRKTADYIRSDNLETAMSDLLQPGKFSAPIDADKVAADWRQRGYSCNLFVDPPGQQWLDFTHACNELVTVVEGRLEMTVGDARLEMGPGDEVFIPAHALHSVINIHNGISRWLFGYD
jgi:mannose-6-phosphate isomerase-like protein (cupin superfamily)